jgi:hypothetical protein
VPVQPPLQSSQARPGRCRPAVVGAPHS